MSETQLHGFTAGRPAVIVVGLHVLRSMGKRKRNDERKQTAQDRTGRKDIGEYAGEKNDVKRI